MFLDKLKKYLQKYNVLWLIRNVATFFNPKSAKKKMHLKMSAVEVVCCKWLPNITD